MHMGDAVCMLPRVRQRCHRRFACMRMGATVGAFLATALAKHFCCILLQSFSPSAFVKAGTLHMLHSAMSTSVSGKFHEHTHCVVKRGDLRQR